MLTLYTSTGSCSRASHIALEESGLGAVLGGTYMLHDDGLEMLVGPGDVPLEVIG